MLRITRFSQLRIVENIHIILAVEFSRLMRLQGQKTAQETF